ncbi:MAG: cation:proton antiporter [Bacteroidia bacterium]|nr:cation:proton antiporter [Bacteroidia bacterium]
MHDFPIFIFTALLILGYGLVSKKLAQFMITAPMVFVAMGLVAGFFQLDFLHGGIRAPFIKIIAEVTLVLILFIDASTIDTKALFKAKGLPFRLLLIGLPLTMVFGIMFAIPLFPSVEIWMIMLMAFILSPTDAALGRVVVTSKFIPEKIRQTINVESGLNDGLALPPILVCIAFLSTSPTTHTEVTYWVFFILKQLIFGPVIGAAIGWGGGWLVDHASRKGWMSPLFQRLSSLSLAILAFSTAELIHGNGFIAAFFAGLFLHTHIGAVRQRLQDFGEAESQALSLFVFLIFGMILVPMAAPFWDLYTWIYAILSLTVIRMVPVAISLIGTKLPWRTVGFIGWFGPRGIASILYLLLVLIKLGPHGYEQIMSVVVLTVLLSIFLHGLSAVPLSKQYRNLGLDSEKYSGKDHPG